MIDIASITILRIQMHLYILTILEMNDHGFESQRVPRFAQIFHFPFRLKLKFFFISF